MGEDTPGTEAEGIGRVGRAALKELLKRLEDPAAAKELPGTGLLQIASSYTKLEEKRLERDLGKDDGPQVDEVDVILESPLPAERKREQLASVLAQYERKRQRILTILEGEL